MDIKNRYDGIDEYAVRLIRRKSRQLVGNFGLTESDIEDLEQEMVLDLLRRLLKFNPQRAKRNTFVDRVVKHKVATIIEAKKAGKRDYRSRICSLNQTLEDENGNVIERVETIDQEDYFRRIGRLSRPMAEERDLAIDLKRVIPTLPPELRALYERLNVESITEISREMGVSRGTIYESIWKLRTILEDFGLKDYL